MHFGATLRLLRLESGLSLRDLARRLDVSGAYLSRVENGLDSIPTVARLEAIARELDLPSSLLMSLAHRVSPLVVDYVRQVPEAGYLFLDIAHRRLDARQLAEVQVFLDERFPCAEKAVSVSPGIRDILAPERIILGMICSNLDDVFDIAAGRIARVAGKTAASISRPLKEREHEISSAIGGSVAVPCAYIEDVAPTAVLVTLQSPLKTNTPDGVPLRVVVILAGPRNSAERRLRLAHIARLTAHGAIEPIKAMVSPTVVLAHLALSDIVR